MADVTLAGAHIALASAPAEAEASAAPVVDEYKAAKYEKGLAVGVSLPGAIESRGGNDRAGARRVRLRDERDAAAARDRQDYAERGAFLDAARSVIDQIVAFHADAQRKGRIRVLRGNSLARPARATRGQPRPVGRSAPVLAALQRRLTKDDVVLSYAVLPRELLVWIIGRNRFEQHRVSVTAPELEDLVNRFQQSLLDAIRPAGHQRFGAAVSTAGRFGEPTPARRESHRDS